MPRHSKNAKLRPYFTSGEREAALGTHGTKHARLGQASQQGFDMCGLCLAPLEDPVAAPSGALYCRECILENLLAQTQQLAQQRRLFEADQARLAREAAAALAAPAAAAVAAFAVAERSDGAASTSLYLPATSSGSSSSSSSSFSSGSSSSCSAAFDGDCGGSEGDGEGGSSALAEAQGIVSARVALKIDPRSKQEKQADVGRTAFWAPAVTPNFGVAATAGAVARPDASPRDPASGAFLKAKDLIKLRLSPASGEGRDVAPAAASDARFACPACLKGIVFQRTFLLRLCGHVMCESCVGRLGSAECPECGAACGKEALLALHVGGSSFAAGAGTQAEASKAGLALLS